MSQALSPSFACCYGLARVARVWKISRASVYRSLKETPPNTSARRPGPVGACSDAELADHIRRQIDASRLHGEGYRKLWARLRFAGVRASPRRVRRVMRENGLLAPHRVLRTEAKLRDGTIRLPHHFLQSTTRTGTRAFSGGAEPGGNDHAHIHAYQHQHLSGSRRRRCGGSQGHNESCDRS